MGTLRTLYAIAVVFGHSWPSGSLLVGSKNAVQLFYIISGFLISYVLVEKQAYARAANFYVNRYLRLYPMYVAVALLTLCAYFPGGSPSPESASFFGVYAQAPATANALLTASNLFLFGQDWVMFAGVKQNALNFVTDFMRSDVVLYPGLIVPQAWTLGVELTFYLIAPFVLPRRKVVYLLLALSIGLRMFLIAIGLGMRDPWSYRFFPTELAFFLAGALAHQVLRPHYQRLLGAKMDGWSNAATGLLIAFSISYSFIPARDLWKPFLLFGLFVMLVPFAFHFQSRFRLDNWIGNLSYPIYIGHVLILSTCGLAMKQWGVDDQRVVSIACVVLAIGFAILLNKWIGDPFERIRDRFRKAVAN